MNDGEIRAATREIVAEILELDRSELRDEAPFTDFGANSVQQMEIVAALSERFGISYSLREEGIVHSIDDAVAITRPHLS
jgi:acyl carrier protein